jgi:hypothetical protein
MNRSSLLYWAAVAVGSRESPELEDTYQISRGRVLELFRVTLGGPAITYWDLCGAMVYHKWLSPIRPIGELTFRTRLTIQAISSIWRMNSAFIDTTIAFEIATTLRQSKLCTFDSGLPLPFKITSMSDNQALLTFSYSIASGCPPHYNDRAKAAEQANWLLSLPTPLPGDYRLAATFEYEELSREYGM